MSTKQIFLSLLFIIFSSGHLMAKETETGKDAVAPAKAQKTTDKKPASLDDLKPGKELEVQNSGDEESKEDDKISKGQAAGNFPKISILGFNSILFPTAQIDFTALGKKLGSDINEADDFVWVEHKGKKLSSTLVISPEKKQFLDKRSALKARLNNIEKKTRSISSLKSHDKLETDFNKLFSEIKLATDSEDHSLISKIIENFCVASFRSSLDQKILEKWMTVYFRLNLKKNRVPGLPPYLNKFQDDTFGKFLKTKRGSLRINVYPENATVYVNDKKFSGSNLVVSEIPVGKNLVTIERDGFISQGAVYDFSSKPVEIKNVMLPEKAPKRMSFLRSSDGNGFDSDPAKAVKRLIGSKAKADYYLLSSFYPNERGFLLVNHAYAVKDAKFYRLKDVIASNDINEIGIEYDQVLQQVKEHFYGEVKLKELSDFSKVSFLKFSEELPAQDTYLVPLISAKGVDKNDVGAKTTLSKGEGMTLLEKLKASQEEDLSLESLEEEEKPVTMAETNIDEDSLLKNQWFWIGVGIATTAVITGVLVLNQEETPDPEGSFIFEWPKNEN